jgi:hypothetical protein
VLRRYKYPLLLLVVIAALVGLRAALPYIVKDYVNERLQALESYDGSVADIDMSLWRGAYRIDGIRIVKEGSEQPTPFFSADFVDFSVEWPSLLKGSLVAEGVFGRPNLNLVQSKDESQEQLGEEVNWAQRLEEFFPFRFNTVEVRDATITFRAPGIRTQDALTAHRLNGVVSNLTNVVEENDPAYADFRFEGQVLGSAPVRLNGSLNPSAPAPTFDVNLELEKVQLPKVNPWLRQYIKADAESGDFELYLEIAAADGKFKGYAKPVMQNVNILSAQEHEPSVLRKLWEGLVDFAANILENDEEEQVAARVPFTGTIENPDADLMATIASVLHNAFVSAFARSLEGSISLRDVKENLSTYGDSDADKKDDDKKDEDKKTKNNKVQKDRSPSPRVP